MISLLLIGNIAVGQSLPAKRLPRVTTSALLVYPIAARALGIAGTVKLEVETDGSIPTKVVCVSGPPIFYDDSERFVKSWTFSKHKETAFLVTIDFKLVQPKAAIDDVDPEDAPSDEILELHLPAMVSLQSTIIPNSCPGIEIKLK